MTAGALLEIRSPTKGFTQFQYSPNYLAPDSKEVHQM